MYSILENDKKNVSEILEKAFKLSSKFLEKIEELPVVSPYKLDEIEKETLANEGIGANKAIEKFRKKYEKYISAMSGPRCHAYVIGGATPAAIAADWLVSSYDQVSIGTGESGDQKLEEEAIELLKDLLHLPSEFYGSFVSGATIANFVGLGTGRQWVGDAMGLDITTEGLYSIPPIKVLSATPHISSCKCLSMLGMGRKSLVKVACIKNRECMDIQDLEKKLIELDGHPCIVLASAGTVNTVDFDDFKEISKLKKTYPFWLHIDGAFGSYARCSPKYSHLLADWECADSITIDCHKWLNVPYDSGVQLTRHPNLQLKTFHGHASYLGNTDENFPPYLHMTPVNSRRFRALPAWMSLVAYGKQGYREIIERNCRVAQTFSQKIANSTQFKLLAPTRLNVVCFTLKKDPSPMKIQNTLDKIKQKGKAYIGPTTLFGMPGMRAAFCNWRTTEEDVEIILDTLKESI